METYRSVTWASSCSSPTRSKGAVPAVSLVSAGWKTHSEAEEAKASMQSADWPEDSVTQLVSFTQSILLADDCPTTTQALSTLQPPLQLVVSVLSVALALVLPLLELLALLEAASGRMAGSKQAAATTSVQDHIFPLTLGRIALSPFRDRLRDGVDFCVAALRCKDGGQALAKIV
ncbi:hypothetical protein BBJ28_00019471 [Nothophytophthora sp. Chile5]|nr:hypothetical protein BBJ28_00019471 [Nothophytophthora sp. Chile5]